MPYDSALHHRRSHRLSGYDYSQPGIYHVTICSQHKEPLFGQVVEGEMHRNELGEHIALCWKWLAKQHPYVEIDEWIVMTNHLHGILLITEVGAVRELPLRAAIARKPLGRLIGAFKTVTTNWWNQRRGTPGSPLWQRDFYDHIVRNNDELEKIREYVRTNPLMWNSDPDYS